VPRHCKTDDGFALGYWTSDQRKAREIMEPDRRQRLESLPGWSWKVLSDNWEKGFFHLKRFVGREGHCRVPRYHKSDDGFRLGLWVNNQKAAKESIHFDRRQRLEALLGWSWDTLSDQWEKSFLYLKQFSEREKHCQVPRGYKTDDGLRLDSWVQNQRSAREIMEPDRRQRLESLPGWSWKVLSDQWEKGFSRLKQFSGRNGHCRVPRGYRTDDGFRLGIWARNQRASENIKNTMRPDRRQRLESLPGWSWNMFSGQWEKSFYRLQAFLERNGHCRVPQGYRTDDGFRLGSWVSNQRTNKTTMKPDRRQRLEALPGWVWKVEK
jgi:hypothetical protein